MEASVGGLTGEQLSLLRELEAQNEEEPDPEHDPDLGEPDWDSIGKDLRYGHDE